MPDFWRGDRVDARETMRVYIDEAGDRGVVEKSSPGFTFAAVAIRASNADQLTNYASDLKVKISQPQAAKVKWMKLGHPQRVVASTLLGSLPIRLMYVHVDKASARAQHTNFVEKSGQFYNWPAKLILERITMLAAERNLNAEVTFEKVRGLPHSALLDYIDDTHRSPGNTAMRWDHLARVEVRSAGDRPALTAADHAVGAWYSATTPDQYTGILEPAYLLNLAAKVRTGPNGRHLGTGIKAIYDPGCLVRLPWWAGSPFR